ncbi:N-formylglutamate amidohydrolase [Serratia marcescens]|uniref:N-formylglutamate amidohydrolase n=1 Tax=Serratia surfactantfaciens TaxID=2741499 RepID=A0ABS0M1Q8_9GAMM|nr:MULTISPECIES: N-formylglutamate amidohydrolase [Serratia]MBH1921474.1 N-formylglutamate amidohydrolase [Serratia surfactantfaciens]MTD05537.1 N-formylglutamate amidohydrolase [Serratia sp. YC16]WMW59358.1 N-formylglutamate amidohydrolase [Serratia marcescens]BEO61494.1 N-formylglutamate amidohydrolase [Serratia marcescens]
MPHSFIPSLLSADEPPAVAIETPRGGAPFLLLCDHAGKAIPQSLGDLGLPPGEIERHIGWDIGALSVSCHLSRQLDATLIHQRYSRLVIDCNRAPGIASSIPHLSELTPIPGNIGIDAEHALAREREVFLPYHRAIDDHLGQRRLRELPTAVIAMHSFTPVFKGESRPWQVGLLFNRYPEFAHLLAELLREEGDLQVGINQPYAMTDATDYTLPVHAERRGLPYVGIEIRQDLIADEQGQQAWAKRFARLLPQAWQRWQI